MSVILAQSPASSGGAPSVSSNVLYTERVDGFPALPSPLAPNSIALGSGAQTSESADNAIAMGSQSLARHPGALVFANGQFGSAGDAQEGKYMLRTHTMSSVPTEAFLDGAGGSYQLTLPDDSTWTFTAVATAHRTDVGDDRAGFKVEGVIYRKVGAASISFQGEPTKTVIARSDPSWDINITPDHLTGSLVVFVTGHYGKNIRWAISINTVEVTN